MTEAATIHAFGLSHPGGRANNEDVILAVEEWGAVLIAVADGLGGLAAGEVASALAVEVLKTGFIDDYRPRCRIDEAASFLKTLFARADIAVKNYEAEGCRGMATTLVTSLIFGDTAIICNTGDSQAILAGPHTRFRSKEHSLVAGLVQRGTISPKEARTHPLRHIITHAVGGDFAVDCDIVDMQPGDMLVLSSDGLHDFVGDEAIETAATLHDPREIAWTLMNIALPLTTDNASLVVYVHQTGKRGSAGVPTRE